ncbi:glycosyltransferase [Echinicola shivajiensis]|uniref:glycosyltransferase n=1 Tax=Echinicola shivajiensis TaxID=1035916 RepID=UPI001BFC30CB|nr:glycosyltransferase [Echinicola shivajiensis]
MTEQGEKLKASLIISVYKNTKFLKAVLDSLADQTENSFEVIISEDGNSREMKAFIDGYSFKHPFKHLHREDLGWQKNRALNEAVRKSESDWLVFIDGDCVLHPRFMEFHISGANPNHILAGKRIKLDATTSDMLLNGELSSKNINRFLKKNFRTIKKRGAEFVEEGFFIDPKGLFGFLVRKRSMRNLKGCNMSFHKEAIYAINGFDEDYTKPAVGEDADLLWRFNGLGYQIKSLRNLAVQYHLYHKESWTDQKDNLAIMEKNRTSNKFVCENGISKK